MHAYVLLLYRWSLVGACWGGLSPSAYFDFEGSLEATGEEAPEGSDEGGEGREEDAMDLERVQVHRPLQGQGTEQTQDPGSTLRNREELHLKKDSPQRPYCSIKGQMFSSRCISIVSIRIRFNLTSIPHASINTKINAIGLMLVQSLYEYIRKLKSPVRFILGLVLFIKMSTLTEMIRDKEHNCPLHTIQMFQQVHIYA